jgi:diguanylate cyclase (GGDEF)-like protein
MTGTGNDAGPEGSGIPSPRMPPARAAAPAKHAEPPQQVEEGTGTGGTGGSGTTAGTSLLKVLRVREFRGLFAAHLLSLLGDRMATVAISVLVYSRSGSLLLTATAYATSLLPWLLGAPFLAALSDRWPRKRVLLVCDALRAALTLLLALPGLPVPVLLLVLTAVAWLGPPFEAARAATLPVLLPAEDDYVAGSSLTMLSNQFSQVLGLAAGGALLSVVTIREALLLDAGTFVLSFLLIATSLKTRPAVADRDQVQGLWRQVAEGAALVFHHRLLRSVLLLAWLMAAITVLPEGLAIAQAAELGAPSWAGGALMAAVPGGAAVGAVVLGRASVRTRQACLLPLSVLAVAALAGSAAITSWQTLWGAWFLVGVGAAVQLPASATFMREVPDAFRARAFGLAQTGLMAGQGLALVTIGALAGEYGVATPLLCVAATSVVGLVLLFRPGSPLRQQSPTGPRHVRERRGLSTVDRWIALVALGAAVAAPATLMLSDTRASPRDLPVWLAAAMFFATGSWVASVRIGRQAHVLGLDDVPRLVGLFFLSPAGLLGARLVGALAALVLVRRQRGRKLVFNLASFSLEVTIALAVFQALVPPSGIGPWVWPAALVATVSADVVSAWTVGVIIGLSERDLQWRRVLVPDRMAMATAVGAATVGMIAVTTLWFAPESALLMLLLVGLGVLALRGYAQLTTEGQQQVLLQEVMRELANLDPSEASLQASMEHLRLLLMVERLECWIAPTDGRAAAFADWSRVQADDCPLPDDPDGRERLRLQLAAYGGEAAPVVDPLEVELQPGPHDSSLLISPPLRTGWRRDAPSRSTAGSHGPPQMATALFGDQSDLDPGEMSALSPQEDGSASNPSLIGVLIATAPLGDNRLWTSGDVELLRTAAELLGQALMRVQHRHELLMHARRDALTDLATLPEFRRQLAGLLEGGGPVIVLLVNLSRLRSVNDVFGRSAGDDMIAAAAERLREVAPEGSVLGRVSGHHFACAVPRLLPSGGSQLARRIRTALEKPLTHGLVAAELGATVGVSVSPAHGRDPEVLLRRAESAGDAAKESPFGVSVFVPDLEQDDARPLRLVSDLRVALQGLDQLSLHYQPKLSLLTGEILGSEALLRWTHPELGPIGPDEFIPLAESTGLISQVTSYTIDQALAQSARWTKQGLPAQVAVNLSARTLLDSDLVNSVSQALRRHRVDPDLLTLEITETSVMAQPLRSIMMLDALNEIGITLSVDDFGTGYSNLSYLRQLPVQEVKLDRTFLSPLRGELPLGQGGLRAQEFLRHAVALVHSLGLYVVVEGVEDEASLLALQALGADCAQGYHICRPQPAEALTAWLRDPPQHLTVLGNSNNEL